MNKLTKVAVGLAMAFGVSANALANWSEDALTHQYRLQKHEPIVNGIVAGTHNSYSSNAYNLKLYENQNASITDQLNYGSRFLELDIWRTRDVEYGAVYVCHSGIRCSQPALVLGDYVYLDTMLEEVAAWSKNNPDQVIVIKLENGNMGSGDYHLLVESIQRQIGDIIYRPQRINDGEGFKRFPADLTPAQMLDQGKQIILFGGSAAEDSISRAWVFKNTSPERGGDDVTDNLDSLVNCGIHGNGHAALFFDQAEEDYGADHYIPTDKISTMAACGGTYFAFDWLKHDDARMKEVVWSWAENQPDGLPGAGGSSNVQCAVSYNGRFYDDDCGLSFNYACKDETLGWKVTAGKGAWSNGESICQSEFGGNYHFDVPRTSSQNKTLKGVAASQQTYWLNYNTDGTVDGNGIWSSGEDKTYQAARVDKSNRLKVARWTDFNFVYDDDGSGANNDISIWKTTALPTGWHALGHVPGLATNGNYASYYERRPGSALVVFDDGSGKLAKPLRYDWKWNDVGTGGDHDVTFWHPVAPAGYTCLGDIAMGNHSWSQPNEDIRCVRDDLLLGGHSWFYWSDTGSGGDYDANTYITTGTVDSNIKVALPANTIRLSGGTTHKVLNYDKVNFENGPQSIVDHEYRELKVMGKCLDASQLTNGGNAYIYDCADVNWQKWRHDTTTGFIHSKHNPEFCLDSKGGNSNFSNVGVWHCEDNINLKWNKVGNTYRPRYNNNLALDVYYGSTANGTNVQLYSADGNPAQTFSWGDR